MSFRSKEIYIQGKTLERLFRLQRLNKYKATEEGGIITVDKIADELINKAIEHDYPDIKALEKRMNALEEQMTIELENQTSKGTKQ